MIQMHASLTGHRWHSGSMHCTTELLLVLSNYFAFWTETQSSVHPQLGNVLCPAGAFLHRSPGESWISGPALGQLLAQQDDLQTCPAQINIH